MAAQAIRVFNQVVYFAHQLGYIIPDLKQDDDQSGYVGAKVLDAVTGTHQQPVVVQDFTSLYPRWGLSRFIL